MFLCPKCKKVLTKKDRSYVCEENHQYDIAKEGYVNLILANQKNSKEPGDPKESLVSRRTFLYAGYYEALSDVLNAVVKQYVGSGSFLDAGCGVGYYLERMMLAHPNLDYYAVDIAKEGVKMCAKRNKQANCAVASVFHLPLADHSLDGLMSVFCPYSAEEFSRIVKEDGYVISVTPGKRHLYEMKEIVYANPYENDEAGYTLPDFDCVEQRKVTTKICLKSKADIEALWTMTPYVHKTSKDDTQKLYNYDTLETTIDFLVGIYQKKRG